MLFAIAMVHSDNRRAVALAMALVEAIWCVVAGRRWWLKGDRG